MKILKVRLTKEDPIPDNLQLPSNEVLLAPKSRTLFYLKSYAAMPAVFRQSGMNQRNVRVIWLTLTSDRGWREKLRRIRCHVRDEVVKVMTSGPFLFHLGIRRGYCACSPGLGHRKDCPGQPRLPSSSSSKC